MAYGFKTGGKDFQKGKAPKSKGRPPLTKEIKALRKLTTLEFIERVNKYFYMSKDQLREGIADPKTEVLDLCIRNALIKCIEKGDYSTLDKMLDRTIGKVKLDIEFGGQDGRPIRIVIQDANEKTSGRKQK